METNQALLVAQLLIKNAGSRIKLGSFHSCGEGYYRFRVLGRRGLSPKVVMPAITTRTYGISILSILDETAGKHHRWMFNGQPTVGFKQLAHFGDCGKAYVLYSKERMDRLYAYDIRAPHNQEARQKAVDAAPELETLYVRDLHDQETAYPLPSPEVAQRICAALKGVHVHVHGEVELYKSVVETFGIGLIFGKGEYSECLMTREYAKTLQGRRAA
jgi:hypothetical protein